MSQLPPVRFMNPATPPHIATLIVMAAIGAMAMNIFLPSMQVIADYFDTSYGVIQLSVTLYLVMNAMFQIVIGPLSDRFGRKPVMLYSTIIFILATIGCLMAKSVEMFLIFRMIQGVIVAGLVLSRAIVRDMVPADQAASMIGFVTMIMAIVPMIAPAIGGLMQPHFGWQSSFWAMLVLGIVLLILVLRDQGETALHRSKSLTAQFREYPELFRSQRFWAFCFAATSTVAAYFAYIGGAAFVGSQIFNLPPQTLGFYFAAPGIGYVIGNGISGLISRRMGVNRMILTGSLIATAGMTGSLILFLTTTPIPIFFFGGVVFLGLGNGITLPNAMSGMLSVRPHLAGSASGIGGTIMTGGGALMAAGAAQFLTPETGAIYLIIAMVSSSFTPVLLLGFIRWRERRVA